MFSAGHMSEVQGSRKRKSRWMDNAPGTSAAVPPPKITIIAPSSVGGGATPKLPGVAGVGGTGTGLEGVADNDWGFGVGGGVSTSSLGSKVNPVGMIGTTELSPAQMIQLKEQQEVVKVLSLESLLIKKQQNKQISCNKPQGKLTGYIFKDKFG